MKNSGIVDSADVETYSLFQNHTQNIADQVYTEPTEKIDNIIKIFDKMCSLFNSNFLKEDSEDHNYDQKHFMRTKKRKNVIVSDDESDLPGPSSRIYPSKKNKKAKLRIESDFSDNCFSDTSCD